MIPVYKPYLAKEVLEYAHEALESTWISSSGEYIDKAKKLLSKTLGVKHVLLTCNGTVANHLMAKCLRLRTHTRNILVPSNAYVAAWNPFLYENFFRLIPVDMDMNTWNANLEDQLHRTQNLLLVHNLGNIQPVDEILNKYKHLNVVEDACEAFGGSYIVNGKYRHAGTATMCGTFSFYGNKNITSGEGGAFVTNDDELYEYASHIWGQAQNKQQKFIHDHIGYNYRMTNVQAAILYGQLKHWKTIKRLKNNLFTNYKHTIRKFQLPNVSFQVVEKGTIHSNWMFGIRIHGSPSYKTAKKFFNSRGIETRPFFYPINYHEHLKRTKTYPEGNLLSKEIIILPSYPELSEDLESIKKITSGVKEYAELFKDNIF